MSFNRPVSSTVLRQIKKSAIGFNGVSAGERIIEAAHLALGGEITVLDATSVHELFRAGVNEAHGGVHVHEAYVKRETWDLKTKNRAEDAVPLKNLKDDWNYYVGKLLQALETGQYRKKRG